jgi:hypothetical protein
MRRLGWRSPAFITRCLEGGVGCLTCLRSGLPVMSYLIWLAAGLGKLR